MPSRLTKRWVAPPHAPDTVHEALRVFPTLFRQILFNRGISGEEDAGKFLAADLPVHDPYLLKGMPNAVERVLDAIERREQILVFGDYDVDGVTAAVLLFEALTRLGGRVIKYIPNRFDEGYGLSMDALEAVIALRPGLLITVDCGVRSVNEIAQAGKAGIDVIVTDHHQPYDTLPEAVAVICPKQAGDEYPFQSLAGVGLAYKLAEAIAKQSEPCLMEGGRWLDLVALGTIADLAPLVDENRALVRRGLEEIRKGRRPGLMALANVSGLNIHQINSENIGFMLGPRLNAAGRLGSADIAFQLLTSTESEECGRLAVLLDKENSRRQVITREIQLKVESMAPDLEGQWILLNCDEEFNEGVIGLAASRLTDTYYRPAIIGSLQNGFVRASCRSIPEVNITHILDQVSDLLIQHGGHAMAAGLKMEEKNIGIFFEKVSALVEQALEGQKLTGAIEVDAEVSLPDLRTELLDLFPLLEPVGEGNPAPLFVARGLEILYPKAVGADRTHLKFAVRNTSVNGQPSVVFDAIAFNFGYLEGEMARGARVDILFSYEWNEFNGMKKPQLKIRDIQMIKSP